MAVKYFCDICEDEFPKTAAVYQVEVTLVSSGERDPSGSPRGKAEHVCERCARSALASPPRESPEGKLRAILRGPVERALVGLGRVDLVRDVLDAVASNAPEIAKAVR